MNVNTGEIRHLRPDEIAHANEIQLTKDEYDKLHDIPAQSRVAFWKQFNPKKAKRLGY